MEPHPDSHSPELAAALGQVSSGLYIATALAKGIPVGMVASFVEQAAFNPPMVTISLGPSRRVARALQEEHALLGLNVLGENNGSLMKPFFAAGEEADPFSALHLVPNPEGLPQLADALAFLSGPVRSSFTAGDHMVFLVEITHGTLQNPDAKPMVRHRKSGFQY
jgi:flavin reductase (DIM6/NTAB) family NADH-FMN oxidoreductase RutF